MEGTFDSETRMLAWTVAYSGLSSPALSADFHGPAPPGEIAPIQVATPGDLASPFHGLAKLDDAQARDLMDGRWYFNLHSKRFPAGEIRGPVVSAGEGLRSRRLGPCREASIGDVWKSQT